MSNNHSSNDSESNPQRMTGQISLASTRGREPRLATSRYNSNNIDAQTHSDFDRFTFGATSAQPIATFPSHSEQQSQSKTQPRQQPSSPRLQPQRHPQTPARTYYRSSLGDPTISNPVLPSSLAVPPGLVRAASPGPAPAPTPRSTISPTNSYGMSLRLSTLMPPPSLDVRRTMSSWWEPPPGRPPPLPSSMGVSDTVSPHIEIRRQEQIRLWQEIRSHIEAEQSHVRELPVIDSIQELNRPVSQHRLDVVSPDAVINTERPDMRPVADVSGLEGMSCRNVRPGTPPRLPGLPDISMPSPRPVRVSTLPPGSNEVPTSSDRPMFDAIRYAAERVAGAVTAVSPPSSSRSASIDSRTQRMLDRAREYHAATGRTGEVAGRDGERKGTEEGMRGYGRREVDDDGEEMEDEEEEEDEEYDEEDEQEAEGQEGVTEGRGEREMDGEEWEVIRGPGGVMVDDAVDSDDSDTWC